MVTLVFNNGSVKFGQFSSVSLCVPSTCRRLVKRIRIKQTWGALSFTPSPPGVDCGSKLSNMFVFTLPFSLHWVWAEKPKVFVLGIPVHGWVMKPHFQNMESWFDILDLFIILEWIMALDRLLLAKVHVLGLSYGYSYFNDGWWCWVNYPQSPFTFSSYMPSFGEKD